VRPAESAWILSWLGLGIAVVVLNDQPDLAPFVRYTLLAIIAYVLLTNAEVFGPPIQRWVARLSARSSLNPAPVTRPKGSPSGPQES